MFINCRSHLIILVWLQHLLFKNSIFCVNKGTAFFLNLNFYIKKNFFFNFWFRKLNLFILNFFNFISVAHIDRVLLSRNILIIDQERRLVNSYFN